MRTRLLLSSVVTFLLPACSNGAAPPPLPDSGNGSDTGTSPPPNGGDGGGDGGSSVEPDGGGSSGGDTGTTGPTAFVYSPKGCSYDVAPPTALGYVAPALDSDTSVSGSGATPLRVRLGLGGNTTTGSAGYPDPTTTAAFTWETSASNKAAKVRYGKSPTALDTVQTGYSWGMPATGLGTAVYLHEAHVCGLTPATTYYYQVGGGAPGSEVWSATQSFTTVSAATDEPMTIGISGDARDTVGTWQLVNERMKHWNVSAHLFTGDIVLFGTASSEYTTWLDAVWKDPNNAGQFLTLGEQLFIPVAGNHEEEVMGSGTTAPLFFAEFAVPGSGQYAKSYGSYNLGLAHFLFIDDSSISSVTTGTDKPEADAQVAWIEQDLAKANADRAAHPFIFALSHRGMFSTSMHATDSDVLEVRTRLAPIYAKYNVDGVFNGHDHEYERTKPILPNGGGTPTVATGNTHGTVYVICAGAGAEPYPANGTNPVWRAKQIPFGSQATSSPENTYLGVYQTMTMTPKTSAAPAKAVLNIYPVLAGGNDLTPIDSVTFTASGS